MRNEFAKAMVSLCAQNKNSVFLTGDLGFMALEQVQAAYGKRFINMGVAEQNMVSFAAGLAYEGFIPWLYSIAAFLLLRPYEQIRNDVCLHNLPVKLVGNGGGYGYGIMGATHHILEDIAVMRVLPNMKVYVPFIAEDVKEAVLQMNKDPQPNYLRLNLAEKLDFPIPKFQPWRKIKDGSKGIVIGTGPVTANILKIQSNLEVWVAGKFPLEEMPKELISSIKCNPKILTIEEHAGACGLNEALAALLLKNKLPVIFKSLYAHGYPSGKYGSQKWHQEENHLLGKNLEKAVGEFIND